MFQQHSRQTFFTLILISVAIFIYYIDCFPFRTKRAFSYIANETACTVDHVVYKDGDPIPTDDPCETCRCRPPGFTCVLQHCEVKTGCRAIRRIGECCPSYQCGCEHNGQYYKDGERIHNAESPCYSCYCQGSSITCSLADCQFRFDCEPEYLLGECCPRYDHCPPEYGMNLMREKTTMKTPQILLTNISTTTSTPLISSTINESLILSNLFTWNDLGLSVVNNKTEKSTLNNKTIEATFSSTTLGTTIPTELPLLNIDSDVNKFRKSNSTVTSFITTTAINNTDVESEAVTEIMETSTDTIINSSNDLLINVTTNNVINLAYNKESIETTTKTNLNFILINNQKLDNGSSTQNNKLVQSNFKKLDSEEIQLSNESFTSVENLLDDMTSSIVPDIYITTTDSSPNTNSQFYSFTGVIGNRSEVMDTTTISLMLYNINESVTITDTPPIDQVTPIYLRNEITTNNESLIEK